MHVLVVEDDEFTAELLEHSLLEFGYEVTLAHDGREAFRQIRSGRYRLVVSDWEMPQMSGPELCRQIRARRSGSYVYVILLTSHSETQHVVEGLNAGADDFLTKPFQPQELCVRLRAGERILALEGRDLTIFAMAKLAEFRDPDTGAHLERIREYCRLLAVQLARHDGYQNQIDGEYVDLLYLTSPLHDIGKVGIPDQVLLKPGRLNKEEFEVMKQHAAIGGQTLDAVGAAHPNAQFLRMARDIAWTHHEKYDGSGYPHGLAGEEIPLCGRILAVADVYDALTTKRIYKPAYSHEVARETILEGSGKHFDPMIVGAFLDVEEMFVEVKRQLSSQLPPDGGVLDLPSADPLQAPSPSLT